MIPVGLFILGLFFGSFASVLITRFSGDYSWETIKAVLRGRSECPQCKKILKSRNLIPLVSFLVQKGKCEGCGKEIPLFYPSIEVLSGLVFLLTYLFFPNGESAEIIFWIFTNRCLMILIVSDLRYFELNIPVFYTLVVGTVIFYLTNTGLDTGSSRESIGSALVFAAGFFGAYLCIYYFSKRYAKKRGIAIDGEGFGFGDVFFAGYAGLFIYTLLHSLNIELGIPFVQEIILAVLIYTIVSCLLGIVYYLLSLLISQKQKAMIPFLPAMILALWILYFFPEIFKLFTLFKS